jgi:membrane-associated phospholipid phosphatase
MVYFTHMKGLFYKLPQHITSLFKGKNLLWQGIMVAATAIITLTGLDWQYFIASRNDSLQMFGFLAGLLGFLIPILIPFVLIIASDIKKSARLMNAAFATIQAGAIGLGLTSFYKIFTGRIGLPHSIMTDTSRMFRFGIMRGGAFQGWPSSHTTVAFAMSFALITLFPKNKYIKFFALAYALFIGLGASVAFHWLSDFIAGIILGTIIGITVGKNFLKRINPAV